MSFADLPPAQDSEMDDAWNAGYDAWTDGLDYVNNPFDPAIELDLHNSWIKGHETAAAECDIDLDFFWHGAPEVDPSV